MPVPLGLRIDNLIVWNRILVLEDVFGRERGWFCHTPVAYWWVTAKRQRSVWYRPDRDLVHVFRQAPVKGTAGRVSTPRRRRLGVGPAGGDRPAVFAVLRSPGTGGGHRRAVSSAKLRHRTLGRRFATPPAPSPRAPNPTRRRSQAWRLTPPLPRRGPSRDAGL